MDMRWKWESCDRRDDPVSGARIIQLTSSAAISNNIYGEQPYCSADGKRVAIARAVVKHLRQRYEYRGASSAWSAWWPYRRFSEHRNSLGTGRATFLCGPAETG